MSRFVPPSKWGGADTRVVVAATTAATATATAAAAAGGGGISRGPSQKSVSTVGTTRG
eukprot:evm.model.NODE_35922_length_1142_cov_11.580561.1